MSNKKNGNVPQTAEKNPDVTEQKKENDWMAELKEGLEGFADQLTKSAAKDASGEEEGSAKQEAPAPSKDELARMLEGMKAEFTHTPMKITPDLEILLADQLKEEKKNKKRSAQMIGVLAKHNFYANGLTPEELRTTLEDLGPTYVKIGQIMSSRVDLLPEN